MIMNKASEAESSKTMENMWYFKLPFIEKFSKFFESKLDWAVLYVCMYAYKIVKGMYIKLQMALRHLQVL